MMPSSIPIPLPDGLHAELPRFIKVRQHFNDEHIEDIDAAIAGQFKRFSSVDLQGKSIAIGVGSRGIRPQPPVVRAVVRELKAVGAEPFIVPAMGSHGGGTVEGQTWILSDYGITGEYTGAPIKASMEVVTVGKLDDGTPIYCDKLAFEADYLIPCNRVKPHTDFRARHESGLVKMLAIGMAKHAGAARIHLHGLEHFPEVLPAAAQVFIDNTRMLFAIAMVENAYDKLKHIVRVNSTLELSEVWVTESMREEVEANPNMEIIGDAFDARFDNEGTLQAFS
jgi:hypothetical protein